MPGSTLYFSQSIHSLTLPSPPRLFPHPQSHLMTLLPFSLRKFKTSEMSFLRYLPSYLLTSQHVYPHALPSCLAWTFHIPVQWYSCSIPIYQIQDLSSAILPFLSFIYFNWLEKHSHSVNMLLFLPLLSMCVHVCARTHTHTHTFPWLHIPLSYCFNIFKVKFQKSCPHFLPISSPILLWTFSTQAFVTITSLKQCLSRSLSGITLPN